MELTPSPSSLAKLVVLVVLVSPSVGAQNQEKTVEWFRGPLGSHERAAPDTKGFDQINGIEIEDVTVDGQSITIGEPFPAGDDWLGAIAFRVKNISGQRLAAIQLDLILPEMSHTVAIPFIYGNRSEKEKAIEPGQEVELRVPVRIYEWAKERIIETGGLSRISKAQIRQILISLPDGTKWFSGCVKTANPKNACPVSAP